MNRVKEHLEFVQSKGYEVVYIALQGSQNYGVDVYDKDYKSDVDTKAIVLPTFEDFVKGKEPTSETLDLPVYEDIDLDKIDKAICGVYCIKNINNSKIYVGSSKDIQRRLEAHNNMIKRKRHENRFLNADAILGHSFDFIILEECEEQNLLTREQYWIDKFGGIHSDFIYNCTSTNFSDRTKEYKELVSEKLKNKNVSYVGENNPMYGKKHTKEAKQKMSIALKERILMKGHPKGMLGKTPWNKGIARTENVKNKISLKNKGRIHIHRNNIKKSIHKNELKEYLLQGYEIGW